MITLEDAQGFPDQPGIYFFRTGDTPIYIGKSINIRARVKSHISQAKLSKKELAIVSQADNVQCMTTLNNFDALLLEAQMIQKHKPQYNVLWKDDKHFLYIKITMGDRYPKIYPVRKEPEDGTSLYFGPFKSTQMTEKLLFELRRIIPFCTNRALGKRACFYAKLGYCNPCPNAVERETDPEIKRNLQKEYKRNIRRAISILSGKTRSFTHSLERELQTLSDNLRYEDAITVRNKLFQFSLFLDRRSFSEHSSSVNADLGLLDNEVREFLDKHFPHSDRSAQNNSEVYRIECYDISNLYGKQPTGSMVVFQDGMFMKKEYRKFSVTFDRISDIHMMEEVLTRRLKHDEWRFPDLIILDGGRPQLRHISQLFQKLEVKIPLISIAKRPDRILTAYNNFKPIFVHRDSLFFKLIQSLRDESHRFAKKHHVTLRNRNLLN